MRFEFIDRYRSEFAVKKLCRNMSVSRGAYYKWRSRGVSPRESANEKLLVHIKAAFHENRDVYGSPRITHELRSQGFVCSENRVARLMRKNGIRACTKRKFKVTTTQSRHDLPVAPNLVNQCFQASSPNRLWTSDITYLWTREGWLYLAVILDVFSRQIVGWQCSSRLTKALVINALNAAIAQRRPGSGLIFHSDRGSQYASAEFTQLLLDHKMLQSMSAKGNCYDNSITETFFKTLKTEQVYPKELFETRLEAQHHLFDYIESFYNRKRRHSAIGYLAPVKYEQLFLNAA